jgi:hypothetical protein
MIWMKFDEDKRVKRFYNVYSGHVLDFRAVPNFDQHDYYEANILDNEDSILHVSFTRKEDADRWLSDFLSQQITGVQI